MKQVITRSVEIDGKQLSFELGRVAKQADGSTVVRLGDTMVLVTACAESKIREGVDFLPLTVDYRENTYAGGRIPGGFFKREGRPTESEILTCRLIDRGLRPLFPDGYHRESQIIAWVMSADDDHDPDVLGICGASMALMAAAAIPYEAALAGVRIGRLDGRFVVFPSYAEREVSDLDLVVAGTDEAIVMVECGANHVTEQVVIDALELAHREIRRIIAVQREITAQLGIVKARLRARGRSLAPGVCGAGEGALDRTAAQPPSRSRASSSRAPRSTRVREQAIASLPEDAGRGADPVAQEPAPLPGQGHHARDRSSTASSASTAAPSTRSGR